MAKPTEEEYQAGIDDNQRITKENETLKVQVAQLTTENQAHIAAADEIERQKANDAKQGEQAPKHRRPILRLLMTAQKIERKLNCDNVTFDVVPEHDDETITSPPPTVSMSMSIPNCDARGGFMAGKKYHVDFKLT